MAQLGNSFYADYNGFNEIKEKETMELPSHFINSYDWNSIENIHKEKEKKATSKVLNDKLRRFFIENNVKYTGNVLESVRNLENVLSGKVVPEIVDVEPIETEVVEKKKEIKDKRELLKQILAERKQGIKG